MKNPIFKHRGKRKKATSYEKINEEIIFRLYRTNIVIVRPHEIILNTGRYSTVTTKRRMNQISEELGLGYRVYSRDGIWYVSYMGKNIELVERLVLPRF